MSNETKVLSREYLQGHHDGLKWASGVVTACNPGTGDWLYDDREDLATAIYRGPEMPHDEPAQDTKGERDLFESFWTSNLLSFGPIGGREFTIAWTAWQNRAALAPSQKWAAS